MALLAIYQNGAASNPAAYYTICRYTPDLRNSIIDVRAEVYASAEQRDAYKSAYSALSTLNVQLNAKLAECSALKDAYGKKSAKDQESGKADYETALKRNAADCESLKTQQSAQTQVLQSSKPGAIVNFVTKPGAVAISNAGAVSLADIYAYLAANDLPGATHV